MIQSQFNHVNEGIIYFLPLQSIFKNVFSVMFSTEMAVLAVERDCCSKDTFHVGAKVEMVVIHVAVELHVTQYVQKISPRGRK